MTDTNSGAIRLRLVRLLRAMPALALLALLGACGGGGVVPSTSVAATETSSRTLTPEFAEFVSRKAVAYSPYRSTNRDTEVVTAAMIKQDMELLLQGDFRLIRLFTSTDREARLTLQVIHDNALDIKVMLGAYVFGDRYATDAEKPIIAANNEAELARLVALANHPDFSKIVLAVSVGNETMVSWSFNPIAPSVIAGYLKEVRRQIRQPVTTDDNWALYADGPKVLIDVIDFAAVHTYCELDSVFSPGLWDWQQGDVQASARAEAMMDAALACAKKDYNAVRATLDLKGQAIMPIIIGETGWNAVDVGALGFRAHPVNQKMYFQALQKWKRESVNGGGPANIFYFEAFDEPWKGGDDKWGLFNVNRQARHVVQNLYPASMWEPGSYSATDALYWVPMNNQKVSASLFTLYAEGFTLNEARPLKPMLWNAWENGTSASARENTGVASPDGSAHLEITPQPRQWGWGLALNLKEPGLVTDSSADLSDFAAGTLSFSIKTTYPGLLEVGFYTGRGADTTGYDAYVLLAPGEHGYVNDGQWHRVSIPISTLLAKAPKADMKNVSSAFVIADRYAFTGKALDSAIATKIAVDGIQWSR